MTTPARGSGTPDAADHLHLKRSEKFPAAREAIQRTRFARRGRAADAFRFIEKVELHTLADGRCHLRQQDLAELLEWGPDKLREIRDELEALKWCEVIEGCPHCGNKKAIVLRLNWPTILLASGRKNRPGCMPENPGSRSENPHTKPENPGSHNKDLITDYSQPKPNEVWRSDEAWPKVITKEQLQSDLWLQRHYELRLRLFQRSAKESELEFWSCAEQAIQKGRPPGKLFTGMLKKAPKERFISGDVEEKARRRLVHWQRSRRDAQRTTTPAAKTPVPAFACADRDTFAASEVIRQTEELRLKYPLSQKQQAGAAGPGLLSDPVSGVTDVDAVSVSVGIHPVNPTPPDEGPHS